VLRAVRALPRRIATVSVHTSPLDQPGTGDAGGMNVYVVELSRRLAALGIEVDVFTRRASSAASPIVQLAPGVRVRHVPAGPLEGMDKHDLPAQLCAFAAGVLRSEAAHEPGYYDLVHSHYWLSGQIGWLAAERWGVPLVHSMHTMARVKNASLADGDAPEPDARAIGEAQVVEAADRLLASTDAEAAQLVELYDADPRRVATIAPGVDLEVFRPADPSAARARLGLAADADILAFVGRIQPLKAPDVLLRAVARLLADDPRRRQRLVVLIVGGPSGSEREHPERLSGLARELGIAEVVRFEPALAQERLADVFRAASLVAVPSYNESFGLVALEAQACGTPVIGADVGGLATAVADGVSGLLVGGHDPARWAEALRRVCDEPGLAGRLSAGALAHAERFGWSATAAGVLDVYRDALAEAAAPRRVAVGH
jgi:D-inositol-3-phosphate glycosyltransferase